MAISGKAKVMIVEDGNLLILRFGSGDTMHYDFPGGYIRGDESLLTTLKRECHTGIGCDVEPSDLALVCERLGKSKQKSLKELYTHELDFYFCARIAAGQRPSKRIAQLEADAQWAPLDIIKNLGLAHEAVEWLVSTYCLTEHYQTR